tara:strand:- start:345 stop:518 length:174 start_codon:yes stop_codon:yes gene_type:complete
MELQELVAAAAQEEMLALGMLTAVQQQVLIQGLTVELEELVLAILGTQLEVEVALLA